MKTRDKWLWVAGGYVAAFLAAAGVGWWRGLWRPSDTAMAGMQAFGDAMLAAGVFLVLALVPTAMAVWFLKPAARRWVIGVAVALVLAAAGLVVLMFSCAKG